MTEYGEIFHKIRIGKSLTLVKSAGDVVSPSFLARFEKGESDISLQNFLAVLRNINVTTEEFFLMGDSYRGDYFDKLFYRFAKDRMVDLTEGSSILNDYVLFLHKKVTTDLQRLPIKLAINYFQTLDNIQLLGKNYTNDEVEKILFQGGLTAKNYLLSVETWGEFEIKILTRFAAMIPPADIMPLVRLATEKVRFYQSKEMYENYMFRVLNSVFFATIYTDIAVSKKVLSMMEVELQQNKGVEELLKYQLANALQEMAMGDIKKGKESFENLVNLSQQIGLTFDTFFGFSTQDWLAFEDQVKNGQQHTRILRFEL